MDSTIRKTKLTLKISIGFLLVAVAILIILNSGEYVNSASIPSVSPSISTISYNGCDNHGGVNCSILNPDASVTCNDGTIDQSFLIYAVTQCQNIIEASTQQQLDFMTRSGCFPPSEMGCISNESYKNLLGKLKVSGLENSELGKGELNQCSQQIKNYQLWNKDYQECLIENNNPDFNLPTNRLVQPLFKAVFCPIFYGNSTYDSATDQCFCDNGYFLSGEKCVSANLICQSKYGQNSYAKNGNCSKELPFNSPSPLPTPNNFASTAKPSFYAPSVTPDKLPPIHLSTPRPSTPNDNVASPTPDSSSKNFISKLWSGFYKFIKKLF